MLRKWIENIRGLFTIEARLYSLHHENIEIQQRLSSLKQDLKVTNRAIGRIIAKVDPMYAVDEADPLRKAASDALGDDIIAKLLGEHKASNSYGDQ